MSMNVLKETPGFFLEWEGGGAGVLLEARMSRQKIQAANRNFASDYNLFGEMSYSKLQRDVFKLSEIIIRGKMSIYDLKFYRLEIHAKAFLPEDFR